MNRPLRALITGGSRGIGLSIAQHLARNAYAITLLSRSEPTLRDAISTLSALPQPPSSPAPLHTYISGDIASQDFWTTTEFGAHAKKHGLSKIDVLVNCAGITQTQLFSKMPSAEIQNMVDTNLTAMMVGTRYLLRHGYFPKKKADREGGEVEGHSPVIINMASLLGLQGGFGAVAYAASKAGVLGFTRALATETGPLGIRVNAIVPGYIESDMTKGLDHSALTPRIPLRRFGKPQEVAQAALFLVQNEYAHNCVINLDGGLSAT